MKTILLVLLGLLAAVPSRPATTDRAALIRQTDHRTLLQADSAWSARSARQASGAAIASMLDPDAVILVRGREIQRGPAAARSLRSDSTAALFQRWSPVRGETSADGTRGYTFGVFDLRNAVDSALYFGKYLAWWRKDARGVWKVMAYVRVARPAGPPNLTVPSGFDRVRTGIRTESRSVALMLNEVRSADRAFSKRGERGLGKAFAEWAAPDAAMLGGGAEFVWGPAEIEKSFAGFPSTTTLTWEPTDADVAASGDLAMTVGRARLGDSATPNEPSSERRYLTIWRRMKDGSWKYVNDGGTAGPPSTK